MANIAPLAKKTAVAARYLFASKYQKKNHKMPSHWQHRQTPSSD